MAKNSQTGSGKNNTANQKQQQKTGSGSTGNGLGDQDSELQNGSGSTGSGLGDQDSEISNGSGSTGNGLGDHIIVIDSLSAGLKDVADKMYVAAAELCICIPYLKKAAQDEELKYALRSIGKNFPAGVKVIVIGDAEPWFSDKVIHIAHAQSDNNPQIDTQNKIMELINSEEVPDDFIFSNDDIYFVSPVELHDIQLLKTHGKITADGTVYGKNKERTIALLKEEGLKARNFDTHTPFFFNKEKLVQVFEKFPLAQAEGVLLYSLYMNYHYPNHVAVDIDNLTDTWLLRLISKNASKTKFDELVANKKFLNNAESGWGDLISNYLKDQFPKKSIFEV